MAFIPSRQWATAAERFKGPTGALSALLGCL